MVRWEINRNWSEGPAPPPVPPPSQFALFVGNSLDAQPGSVQPKNEQHFLPPFTHILYSFLPFCLGFRFSALVVLNFITPRHTHLDGRCNNINCQHWRNCHCHCHCNSSSSNNNTGNQHFFAFTFYVPLLVTPFVLLFSAVCSCHFYTLKKNDCS